MFAALVLDREPTRWVDLPAAVVMWIQNAGAVATLGLCIGGLAFLIKQMGFARKPWPVQANVFIGLTLAAVAFYVVGVMLPSFLLQMIFLTAGGLAAFTAAGIQFVPAVFTRFRWIRIWAIARLSIKEAVRSRVILVFSIMAAIFLFADWFVPYKPEDQVRNYVRVIYWSMTPLFLMTAALLGAFNIPNDVRNQSIHTIVTKPVERFEIVLGRFLGYGVVLTAGLAVLSLASLLYLMRGVHPDAARESYTARVPLFGSELSFWGTEERTRGANVGRIWDYRSYITGKQYAIWGFNELPGWLSSRTTAIPFELTFDIFRMRKADKDQPGLFCTFAFVDGRLSVPEAEAALRAMREEERKKKAAVYEAGEKKRSAGEDADALTKWSEQEFAKVDAELIQKYKTFEVRDFQVLDYETQRVQVPPLLFKVLGDTPAQTGPRMNVLVSVEHSPNEREAAGMLGVAKYDFYLLAAERPFWLNFLKGLVGMWCSIMLILGLAVACSTYFNGVISLLCSVFVFGLGYFVDYLRYIASGMAPGGGPLESAQRLVSRLPEAAPLENSPTTAVIKGIDFAYRWVLERFLTVIPDVNRYYLDNYVGNGFDISWTQVLLLDNVLYLIAYLTPWAILSYYLMEFREIANPS